ncbi:MAG TPA: ABC transporter permease [Thermoanaerobaculia bacterium]|nr:ABC transporter permease [Thermoanaerobaculia bacterium]
MLSFTLRRLGLAAVILVVAVSALYGMIHLVPGDPASVVLGPRATPEMKAAIREQLRLDDPFLVQLLHFFGDLLRGDLGTDLFTGRPVAAVVFEQLPHTLVLIVCAIAWAAALGVPLGCVSALLRGSRVDRFAGIVSVTCIALPAFVVALAAQYLVAVRWKLLPALGVGEPGDLASQLRHLVLPAFALGLGWVGYVARLLRASMVEQLGSGYVRTARAFGLPERRVVGHALRVAVLPTVTILGAGIGGLLSGAVLAEIVFARPGIGKLIYDAVSTRNYPVVMGGVLVSTAFFVLSTALADGLNALLDPRLRSPE